LLNEGKVLIRKVQRKQNLSVEVQCLEHPFGNTIKIWEKIQCFITKYFLCDDCDPRLEKVGQWKWTY